MNFRWLLPRHRNHITDILAIHDQHERVRQGLTDDLTAIAAATREPRACAQPPCDPEENWICGYHALIASAERIWARHAAERTGKHRVQP